MLRKLYWAARSTFASPPPPKPEYFSRFGGLWTDRRDALTELDRRAAADPTVAALRDKLAFFIENGYVVLERTVEPADIDAYKRDLLAAAQADSTPLVASVPVQGPQDKDVVPLAQADLDAPLTKVLDTYVHLPSALKLAFADPIVRFCPSCSTTACWLFKVCISSVVRHRLCTRTRPMWCWRTLCTCVPVGLRWRMCSPVRAN